MTDSTNWQTQYDILLSMTPSERELHFAEELLRSDEEHLELLVASIEVDNNLMEYAKHVGMRARDQFDMTNEDIHLTDMEWSAEMILGLQQSKKRTMNDIKIEREHIRWKRKQVQQMQEQHRNSKNSGTSRHSSPSAD